MLPWRWAGLRSPLSHREQGTPHERPRLTPLRMRQTALGNVNAQCSYHLGKAPGAAPARARRGGGGGAQHRSHDVLGVTERCNPTQAPFPTSSLRLCNDKTSTETPETQSRDLATFLQEWAQDRQVSASRPEAPARALVVAAPVEGCASGLSQLGRLRLLLRLARAFGPRSGRQNASACAKTDPHLCHCIPTA